MTILDHIEKIQENLNRMIDQMDDDTYYYDATYHLEQIKEKIEQEPCEDAISRQATLKPYEGLKDDDVIAVWLIRKNIEQQETVNLQKIIVNNGTLNITL